VPARKRVVVTGLGVLYICFRSRNAARAFVFFAVYLVLKQTALAFGVAGKYGANAVTSDAQYYIDLLVVAVLAVALATGRGLLDLTDDATPRRRAGASVSASAIAGGQALRGRHGFVHRTPVSLAVAVLVVLAAHAVATPFGLAYLVHGNAVQTDSRDYVQRLRDSLETVDRSRVHATLVPMLLPGYVAPGFIAPYNRQDVFLQLVPEWRAYDSGPVMAITDTGRLNAVEAARSIQVDLASPTDAVAQLTSRPSPRGEACYTGGAQPGTIALTAPAPVEGAPLVVDVRVQTLRPLHFILAVKTDQSWTYSPLSIGSAPGLHRFVTWLPGNTLSSVALTAITPFSSFCVLNVQVGVMITTADRSGICHSLADEGSIGSVTPCGRPWE